MSSPRNFRADAVKDYKRDDSVTEDLDFRETLPSSSQKKKSKVLGNEANSKKVKKLSLQKIPHDNYEYSSEEASESESDHSVWTPHGSLGRDRWSSEYGGSAGPSQTVSPLLSDIHKIVTEGELNQLAQIRPLIFNFHEQSAIKDCLKMLEKKVAEYDIIQEFMDLEFKNLPGEFIFGNQPSNREKNRYRDILPWRVCIITLKNTSKIKTGTSHFVKHLQFTKWPDHGTPASADGFIKYARYVRKSHLTGPMVVHCSAGVGRTGVFICVDVVFCAIEKNYSFDIMNIATQMREQRPGMIQTQEQYHFCYEIVLKVLQKLLTLD
ncbi:tyrosine-protein phosphatase non-receptor type 20-like isoform X3 [Microcebus murinus]|uniref:tyrosine-protein phosphatase non-receptor type 20 isoform X3 n=1 Tax=Microcebus murinus TaxID=30608 RepID=UPI00098B6F83|nr:tyrosine-protein phosphatase non-receptor type 20 isoform X3 [Microcebus murinus]